MVELNTLGGFEKAVRLEHRMTEIGYSLGRYLQNNLENRDPNARSALSQSPRINPRSAETWLELALHTKQGCINAAQKNVY